MYIPVSVSADSTNADAAIRPSFSFFFIIPSNLAQRKYVSDVIIAFYGGIYSLRAIQNL
jgi:hypothetical protein